MNLTLLILVPFITAMLILLAKGLQQIRVIGLFGSIAQLGLAGWLLKSFLAARAAGNNAAHLFESNQTWFKALHINYHIGIDGIARRGNLTHAVFGNVQFQHHRPFRCNLRDHFQLQIGFAKRNRGSAVAVAHLIRQLGALLNQGFGLIGRNDPRAGHHLAPTVRLHRRDFKV